MPPSPPLSGSATTLSPRLFPVFGYGSNSIVQICARVKNDNVPSSKGFLPKYKRIFLGKSQRWNGKAVASVESTIIDNSTRSVSDGCRGTVVYLSQNELHLVDPYEGCDSEDYGNENISKNVYHRKKVKVQIWKNKEKEEESDPDPIWEEAWCYMKNVTDSNSPDYGTPSPEYVAAIRQNLSTYWKKEDVDLEIGNLECAEWNEETCLKADLS